MSKATIKKLLRSMSKEQIIEMVIEMYDARKEAKDYPSIMQVLTRIANSKSTRILFVKSFILRDVVNQRRVFRYAEKL